MTRSLLLTRRFLPLFLAQALGALNDNLFKNAMVLLIVFRAGEQGGAGLAAAAGGLFILPYALFSAPAGQLADRFDKARLIRVTKAAELVLMGAAAWALLAGSVPGLLAVLFGLGAQATAFGPLKYGILPQHLRQHELLAGNALVEAGTFGAILLGTILGGVLIGGANGPAVVAAAGLVVAALGLVASFAIPPAPAASPGLRIGWNVPAETWRLVVHARAEPPVWRAVLGISWFWALGATYIALFPVLVRDRFGGGTATVTLLLAGFAVGVGAGSMLGSRWLRGRVSVRHVGRAGLALSLFTGGFAALCAGPWAGRWQDPVSMLGDVPGALAWACLLGAAAAGGVFSLPLYATLQQRAAPSARARMVAVNNVLNAAFMVAGAGAIALLATLGFGPAAILGLAALLNLLVAWTWINTVPEASPCAS